MLERLHFVLGCCVGEGTQDVISFILLFANTASIFLFICNKCFVGSVAVMISKHW